NGLSLIQNKKVIKTYSIKNGLPSNAIWSLVEDHKYRMWVGTDQGVALLEGGKIKNTFSGVKTSLIGKTRIESLLTDSKGNIWVGSKLHGVTVFNEKFQIIKYYTKKMGLAGNRVRAMLEDREKNIWIACWDGGLSKITNYKVVKNYNNTNGLAANNPRALALGKDGTIWVGLDGFGLDRIHKGKVQKNYSYSDGLVNSVIYSLQTSRKQKVLVGTGAGLVTIKSKPFDFPVFIDQVSYPLVDEAGQLYQQTLPQKKKYQFKYNQNNIHFRYASINYQFDSKEFFIKLKGYDKLWKQVKKQTSQTYMNLPSGRYIFQVKIKNFDGSWSSNTASVKIEVQQPIWLSIQAIIIYILAFISLVIFLVQWKTHQQSVELQKQKIHLDRFKRIDQIKDEFLANTSHELKTPLHGIIGITESLLDGATGHISLKAKKSLEVVTYSARRLNQLVGDILDLTSLKNGEVTLEKKAVSLNAIINTIVAVSTPLLKKEVKIYNKISDQFPIVYGDENRIHQILYNLIGNAIKFTEYGQIVIQGHQDDDHAIIQVKDTGIGIEAEYLSSIFNTFEQIDSSVKRKYGGTGLGLGIAKKLIELHDGKIIVISEKGVGSCFQFDLPIIEGFATNTIKNKTVQNNVTSSFTQSLHHTIHEDILLEQQEQKEGAKKILIVDDELVNIMVVQKILSLEPYYIEFALNGMDALKLIEDSQKKPDVVLLDMMMPQMTGVEVCQEIRKMYSAIELPVIFFSAKYQVKDIVKGFLAGGNDYISKPIQKEELQVRLKMQVHMVDLNCELQKTKNELDLSNQNLEHEVERKTVRLENSMSKLKEQNQSLKVMQDHLIQTEKMSSLGGLVAGIAHEINNPVTFTHIGAQNLNQKLKDFQAFIFDIAGEDASSELKELFHEKFQNFDSEAHAIIEGTRRITDIVGGLRMFARLDEGEMQKNNICGGLKTTIELVKANYKNIHFSCDFPSEVMLLCWPSQLNQVYMNILINSRQAIEEKKVKENDLQGEIKIHVQQHPTEVVMSFKDNGCGIPN
ncbi:MAG: two-component system sensor histidine kinase ChiS, partial [bacterium]